MYFENIYIIGDGSICISIIKSLLKDNLKPIVIAYKKHEVNMFSSFIRNKGLNFYCFDDYYVYEKKVAL